MNSNEHCAKRYDMLRKLTDMYSTLPDKTIIEDFSTRAEAHGCDMTISLDVTGGVDVLNTMGLYKRQFGKNSPFCYLDSIFKAGNIYFLKAGQGHIDNLTIDHSVTFDSNIVSETKQFIENKQSTNRPAFIEAIDHIVSNHINSDATPYLIENLLFLSSLSVDRTNIIINHFANFLLLSTAKPSNLGSKGSDRYTYSITFAEALGISEQRVRDMVSRYTNATDLDKIALTRIDIYYVLLLTTIAYFDSNQVEDKLLFVLDRSLQAIPKIPVKELAFCLYFFENIEPGKSFYQSVKNMRGKELIKHIANKARDLSWARFLETASSDRTNDLAIFYFLTFDKNLVGLMKLYKYRFVIIDNLCRKILPVPVFNLKKELDKKAMFRIVGQLNDLSKPESYEKRLHSAEAVSLADINIAIKDCENYLLSLK